MKHGTKDRRKIFDYKEAPDFNQRPTDEEIELVASILNGELKGERHGCLPAIRERLEKRYPKVEPEILSRISYLALAVIDDQEIRAQGWRKITAQELEERGRSGKALIYRSSGIFGNSEIKLTPKEIGGRIYWMLPRACRKYMDERGILSSYVKA